MFEAAHHLEIDAAVMAGNQGLGRYVLLPGSPGRCNRIAAHLQDVVVHQNRRRHDVVTGTLVRNGLRVDVAAVPTGMGCPSVDIVVNELMSLGARRLMRVGTAGSLQPSIKAGDLVIASGAVRDEATSNAYVPLEYPAVADPFMLMALVRAAEQLEICGNVHVGILHTKDSFFGREFAHGPDSERNQDYMDRLSKSQVIATEMEAAHLLVLGSVFGKPPYTVSNLMSSDAHLRCGAVCAIIGTPEDGIVSLEQEQAAEDSLIALALESLVQLASFEGVGG
jgi:uridine phosphorylase